VKVKAYPGLKLMWNGLSLMLAEDSMAVFPGASEQLHLGMDEVMHGEGVIALSQGHDPVAEEHRHEDGS